KDLDRLATTKERKQLFGIPTCEKESSYFHQTLIEPTLRVDVNNLLMAGKNLLSKTKQVYLAK
ncbi:MAG TPA: hypothetical protein VN737_09785, partial [Bryobacteraceae bacterium]|nr:hypothetical protein [Bryobacteraceae bacterium]